MLDIHVDRAGDEGRFAADRHAQRMDRIVDRAERRALGHLAQRRGGRILPLRQPVDAVVEQHDFQVDIPPDGMHQMVAADRQAVAVAGDHPDHQIGPADLQAGGDGRGAAVDRVHAVGVHVIRKPARAADSRDEDHVLRRARPASGAPFSFGRESNNRRSRGTSGRPDRWRNLAESAREAEQWTWHSGGLERVGIVRFEI